VKFHAFEALQRKSFWRFTLDFQSNISNDMIVSHPAIIISDKLNFNNLHRSDDTIKTFLCVVPSFVFKFKYNFVIRNFCNVIRDYSTNLPVHYFLIIVQ
jgi:hypothetical protein